MSVSNNSQPPVKDKFTFLKELTAGRHHHAKKSLWQHLFNVYRYLKSQSRSEALCDAGLFHAVYGTEFYGFQSEAISRDVVRGYIGEYGEDLVHTFCGLKKGRMTSIITNEPGWSAEKHLDLLWLEFANAGDHQEFPKTRAKLEVLSRCIERLEYGEPTCG